MSLKKLKRIRSSQQSAKLSAKLMVSPKWKVRKNQILHARPHSPVIHNTVQFMCRKLPRAPSQELQSRYLHVQHYFAMANQKIALCGSTKIKRNMVVATFGFSSTILSILLKAQKKFKVHVIDDAHGNGKEMATALAKHKISTRYFESTGARQALKTADMLFLRAHAITKKGHVVSPIGSELLAEIAQKHHCSVYVAATGWKYDPKSVFAHDVADEKHHPSSLWKHPPKGVLLNSFAFEKLHDSVISAIISEVGIHTPTFFLHSIKKEYPWMRSWI